MKKKKILFILLVCLAAGLAAGAGWKILQTPVPIRCYMLDQCGGCSVTNHPCNVCRAEQQYRTQLEELIVDSGQWENVDFQLYNILYTFYKDKLLETMGVSVEPEDMIYPVAFVGNKMLLGTKEIERRLVDTIQEESAFTRKLSRLFHREKEQKLGWKTVPQMIFFTMEGCPDCEEAKTWLDIKNEELSGKLYEELSICPVGEENAGSWEMLKKVYILHGREQEALWVPTILAGDRCLIGMEEIAAYFDNYQPGEKIETKVPEDYE